MLLFLLNFDTDEQLYCPIEQWRNGYRREQGQFLNLYKRLIPARLGVLSHQNVPMDLL